MSQSLAKVKHIVAVASGKGGVGKSTTAVNIACALQAAGYKVGLLDADLYGPSIPTMLKIGRAEEMDESLIVPPLSEQGLKVISVSMFSSPEKAQILRGPMAGNMVKQFLTHVAWGELDYLILDYPPGTGDIQLTISQTAPLTGALIVTTPQTVALNDVQKTISMFDTLKVPLLGILETMSYFVCSGCEMKHYLFSQNGARTLSERFGIPLLGEIPIDPDVSRGGDSAKPIVSSETRGSLVARKYFDAADSLVREIKVLEQQKGSALLSFQLKWQKGS
ncbi:MAG: Mrp/NBP35 family ATP-binding protein [Oligoflexales bacterium]|nr:Mrp/NBP35 family ATP-binding protein [Oligoflexales bacterium]